MSNTYFSFAFSPSMLSFPATVHFNEVNLKYHKKEIEEAISALNPSHRATINILESRFGIKPEIPEVAPKISLNSGDTLYILQVFGLPRLGGDRKEYTSEEIKSAVFKLLEVRIN